MRFQSQEVEVITIKAYKYGVEIELILPYQNQSEFTKKIEQLGLEVDSDGSISGYSRDECSLEIKTPPLGLTGLQRLLPKVQKLCESYGITINKSCGVHVHTSNKRFFNGTNLNKIVATWCALEDVLIATQPQSRMNNQYCHRRLTNYVRHGFPKLPRAKRQLVSHLSSEDRYYTLNLASIREHGTIECRLHAGSFESKKILNWVKVLTAVYNYALEDYKTPEVMKLFATSTSQEKINQVWALIKLDSSVSDYMNARIFKFLIPNLAKQQVNAHKLSELRPKREKAEKKYRKLQSDLQTIATQEHELMEIFSQQD